MREARSKDTERNKILKGTQMAVDSGKLDMPAPKVAFLNDPKIRGLVFQVILLAVVVWLD